MRQLLAAALAIQVQFAAAQPSDHPCPAVRSAIEALDYPDQDVLAGVYKGQALVQFTILPTGTTSELSLLNASTPSFGEAALAAIRQLRCSPRQTPLRVNQQVQFTHVPSSVAGANPVPQYPPNQFCPNYPSIAQGINIPSSLLDNGPLRAEAVIEVTLAPDGTVRSLRPLSSTHVAFEKAASKALERLACDPPGREVRVLAPFSVTVK